MMLYSLGESSFCFTGMLSTTLCRLAACTLGLRAGKSAFGRAVRVRAAPQPQQSPAAAHNSPCIRWSSQYAR
jgi:hypothetical protein